MCKALIINILCITTIIGYSQKANQIILNFSNQTKLVQIGYQRDIYKIKDESFSVFLGVSASSENVELQRKFIKGSVSGPVINTGDLLSSVILTTLFSTVTPDKTIIRYERYSGTHYTIGAKYNVRKNRFKYHLGLNAQYDKINKLTYAWESEPALTKIYGRFQVIPNMAIGYENSNIGLNLGLQLMKPVNEIKEYTLNPFIGCYLKF